jgi:hypothetical protein
MHVFISCSRKREVILTGFIYRNEKLNVSYKEVKLTPFDFRMENNNTGLLFFYEKRKLKGNNIEVKATIDSAGIRLLDTSVLIPDNNKAPLISFLDPATTPGRKLFVADSDTMLKY